MKKFPFFYQFPSKIYLSKTKIDKNKTKFEKQKKIKKKNMHVFDLMVKAVLMISRSHNL